MTFEPIRDERGQPRMMCICDDCAREEVVAADHGKGKSGGVGQAAIKLQSQGWTYLRKHLRCPTCEAKRKVVNMQVVKNEKDQANEIKEPTKKQRIQIISMLAEVYDIDGGRYIGGDTDDAVAEVLGVMPGWVAEIREAEFGPDGGNEDIETLINEISEFRQQATAFIKANTEQNEKVLKLLDTAKGYSERLDRIKAAIGPRNQKRAGV